jgi:acyl-coenzyme A synthetase/AMP-(fatty) acid ligase
MCLANRAAIVPVPRSELRWPRRLVATLRDARITRVHAVPSVWRPLLRHEPSRLENLTGLTAIMYSGEPFPGPELAALRSALPRARLINCYGPTECMACSFTDITDSVDRGEATLPIDGAYPGSSIAIVDEQGRPIERPGQPGEIQFRGPSVFAGYWSTGSARAPAAGVGVDADGGPTLLTGDFAHWGTDRRLYLEGRRDRQVKVDGNRVELTEIEKTLGSIDGVEQVRVIAVAEEGRIRLTAFVAARDPDGEREAACRHRCGERLPSYMQPSRIVQLRHLPLTTNGKVDQALLVQLAAR